MKKLLALTILGAVFAGSYTGNLSILPEPSISVEYQINKSQKNGNTQTKFVAKNKDNQLVNYQFQVLGNSSNLSLIQSSATKLKVVDLSRETFTKSDTLAAQNILKEAPVGPDQPPTRPLIDFPLNKGSREKGINKPLVNNIQEDPKFKPVMEYAVQQRLSERPMGEIMQAIAEYFIDSPYKAGLLDKSEAESLVITLDGFDCVLFVETVLGIARGVAVQNYSYETFINHIREQRYWNGQINGYCSRLHYFSEWIADNQRRGNVKNVSTDLGGERINKQLFFMSKNRWEYPQIASNDANYQCIVNMENSISKLKIDYIPYYKIGSVYSQLKPGDIIAVATEINGLDFTHTGLVYRNSDGNIGLIHASPAGKVTVAYDLERYIWNVESAIGIVVARPVDPRR